MSQRVRLSWWWLGLAPFLAIVLSPWVFEAIQVFGRNMAVPGLLEAATFRRVYSRILLLSALFLLIPLLIKRNYRRPVDFGLSGSDEGFKRLSQGFLLGLSCMVLLVGWQLAWGIRRWDFDLSFTQMLGFLLTAGVVAFLEEPLFRGVLLGELKQRCPLGVAVVISAGFFASLHFLSVEGFDKSYQVSWHAGWDYTWAIPLHFFAEERNELRWLILFLIGTILATGVFLFRTLWWSIGLHAGWVFAIKSVPSMVDYIKGSWKFWLPKNLLDGVDCLLLLLVLQIGLLYYGKKIRLPLETAC